MTQFLSRRSGTRGPREAAAYAATARRIQNKRLTGLRVTIMAAILMLLMQIGLGFWIAQAVTVPAADNGAGVFTAIGRALADGPVALGVHAGLGLLLVVTAVSAIIRAVIVRRMMALTICVAGLAAVVVADVAGARFTGTSSDGDSAVMKWAALVALACYLLSLLTFRRSSARASR